MRPFSGCVIRENNCNPRSFEFHHHHARRAAPIFWVRQRRCPRLYILLSKAARHPCHENGEQTYMKFLDPRPFVMSDIPSCLHHEDVDMQAAIGPFQTTDRVDQYVHSQYPAQRLSVSDHTSRFDVNS
jgi:hypothetical protein